MLRKILEQKKKEIEHLKLGIDHTKIDKRLDDILPAISFAEHLLESDREMSVIAEVKKASPSKGVIRENFDPIEIATAYDAAGVDMISVLTDETFFQGKIGYITDIKKKFPHMNVLRKDFIIDKAQVYESRMYGADSILLIAAALEIDRLVELSRLAHEYGMGTLIEVHTEAELDAVLTHISPSVIGINNRDLETFEASLKTTEKLMSMIPKEIGVISESGIQSRADVEYLQGLGVRGILVGEHFMKQDDITKAVKELLG